MPLLIVLHQDNTSADVMLSTGSLTAGGRTIPVEPNVGLRIGYSSALLPGGHDVVLASDVLAGNVDYARFAGKTGVVGVRVAQQDGAAEGSALEKVADAAKAGAGVEQQARVLTVVGEGDAGGVAAISSEVRSRGRDRTSHTAERDPHRVDLPSPLSDHGNLMVAVLRPPYG